MLCDPQGVINKGNPIYPEKRHGKAIKVNALIRTGDPPRYEPSSQEMSPLEIPRALFGCRQTHQYVGHDHRAPRRGSILDVPSARNVNRHDRLVRPLNELDDLVERRPDRSSE